MHKHIQAHNIGFLTEKWEISSDNSSPKQTEMDLGDRDSEDLKELKRIAEVLNLCAYRDKSVYIQGFLDSHGENYFSISVPEMNSKIGNDVYGAKVLFNYDPTTMRLRNIDSIPTIVVIE
jgi:hypothetical protein